MPIISGLERHRDKSMKDLRQPELHSEPQASTGWLVRSCDSKEQKLKNLKEKVKQLFYSEKGEVI